MMIQLQQQQQPQLARLFITSSNENHKNVIACIIISCTLAALILHSLLCGWLHHKNQRLRLSKVFLLPTQWQPPEAREEKNFVAFTKALYLCTPANRRRENNFIISLTIKSHFIPKHRACHFTSSLFACDDLHRNDCLS